VETLSGLADGLVIMRGGELDTKNAHPGGAGMAKHGGDFTGGIERPQLGSSIFATLGMHPESQHSIGDARRLATNTQAGIEEDLLVLKTLFEHLRQLQHGLTPGFAGWLMA
jgi:hypothetical protein